MGLVEEGETPAEAAAREVLEETGWRPGPVKPLIYAEPANGITDSQHHIFRADGATRGTRIQLKDFTTGPCPAPDGPVRPVTAWPATVQNTFAPFAETMAADGLAFLHTQVQADRCGPVLATAVEDRIVGAIGPMEVRMDAIGRPQLMPQYFAVVPEARGQGLGRALWRAAMHWGQTHGAAYQLLQTEVGGPSDRLCRSEGLTSLGFSHTTHI